MRPALRRYLALALLLVMAGALAGVAYALARPARAEVSVLVNPTEGNPYNPTERGQDLVNLETEAQLVASDQVAAQVAERLGSSLTPQSLQGGLTVSVPPNTQIVTIQYTAHDRAVAVSRANAFAQAYLEYRQSRTNDLLSLQRAGLSRQIARQSDDLEELIEERSRTSPESARWTVLRQGIRATSIQINDLQIRLAQVERGPAAPGQVVKSPAIEPESSLFDEPGSAAMVGALLGLGAFALIAGAAALGRGRRNTESTDPRGHLESAHEHG